MPWAYIRNLLGPGLHWGRSQEQYRAAVAQAEADGQHAAAAHIRIMWEMRNVVMAEKETPHEVGLNDVSRVGGSR